MRPFLKRKNRKSVNRKSDVELVLIFFFWARCSCKWQLIRSYLINLFHSNLRTGFGNLWLAIGCSLVAERNSELIFQDFSINHGILLSLPELDVDGSALQWLYLCKGDCFRSQCWEFPLNMMAFILWFHFIVHKVVE